MTLTLLKPDMTELTIETYDRCEREARIVASYPAIRAFAPRHFEIGGFPARVTDERELRRYADIMGETEPRAAFLKNARYSRLEAEAIKFVAGQVVDLTYRLFKKSVFPFACLFGPITMVRAIEQMAASAGRRLTIMDVGAGSGYLDVYLLNAGHRLIVTDVTQALYLWQNRLFRDDYDMDEYAINEPWDFMVDRGAQVTHIPWWQFARLHESNWLPPVDIVVCDAALAEMEPWATRYVMNVAHNATRELSGCMIYRTIGEPRTTSEADLGAYAREIGLHLGKVTNPAPLGGPADLRIADFLDIPQDRLMESYRFMDFIGIGR